MFHLVVSFTYQTSRTTAVQHISSSLCYCTIFLRKSLKHIVVTQVNICCIGISKLLHIERVSSWVLKV